MLDGFVESRFAHYKVIGIHHRHGNGEVDDFEDGGGRLNLNDEVAVKWLHQSAVRLAEHFRIPHFKVFVASGGCLGYPNAVCAR